ncbi:MAG: Mur ligase family protein [Sarcina sp.]
MKIIFLRFMDGRNIWSSKKVIDLLVRNLDEIEAKKIYSFFQKINDRLSLNGKGIYFEFINDEARMIFTYEYKFISKQIIEDLIKGINVEVIVDEISRVFDVAFERDVEMACIEKNIPFYYYNENEVQIGYGANSLVLNKSNEDINIDYKENFYIPIISVTGSNGKTTTVKLIYNILKSLGYKVGMTSTGGVYVNDDLVLEGDTTGYFSAKRVLEDKEVDIAVLEVARGGIVKQGLAYKNASVAIITSLSNDHLGMEGAETIEELARIKLLVLEEIDRDGVVVCRAKENIINNISSYDNLVVFDDEKTKYLQELILKKVEAYYVEDNYIVREFEREKKKIVDVREIPFAFGGASKSNIRNIICAIIAVRRIHSNLYEIINQVKLLKCDSSKNIGRQNIIEYRGRRIIVDYGHNEEAFNEIFDLVKKINGKGRVISVIGAPGDRRNNDIIKLGKIAANNSDFIVVKELDNKRGRDVGESASLLLYGINKAKFNLDNVITIINEIEAFDYAFKYSKKDDIIIYFVQGKDSIKYVLNYLKVEV